MRSNARGGLALVLSKSSFCFFYDKDVPPKSQNRTDTVSEGPISTSNGFVVSTSGLMKQRRRKTTSVSSKPLTVATQPKLRCRGLNSQTTRP